MPLPSESRLRIGALAFGSTPPPGQVGQALVETLELVRLLERLGYARVWFGEHHSPHLPWSFPDKLVAAALARTTQIHVGTGCVLLSYRNAYQIACDYRLLATIFGPRVELGVGRGVAAEQINSVLHPVHGRSEDPFSPNLMELCGFLQAGSDSAEPFRGIWPAPVGGGRPDLWVMGGSVDTARLAASVGAKFCYSLFSPSSKQDMSVIGAYYESPGCPCGHAVALAGAWQARSSRSADSVEPSGEGTSYQRLAFVGDAGVAADHVQQAAYDYSTEDIVLLNKAERSTSVAEAWAALADLIGLPPKAPPHSESQFDENALPLVPRQCATKGSGVVRAEDSVPAAARPRA